MRRASLNVRTGSPKRLNHVRIVALWHPILRARSTLDLPDT
jgi:hypothetical protein